MGTYDDYEPIPPLTCPVCDVSVGHLQGTDGPNRFYRWRQGDAAPVGFGGSPEDLPFLEDDFVGKMEASRLPEDFRMGTLCDNAHVIEAIGHASHGVWTHTEIVEFDWRPRHRFRDPQQ